MPDKIENMDGDDDNEEDHIGFPLQDIDSNVHMKDIPSSFIPNFCGMRLEDQEAFLFKF